MGKLKELHADRRNFDILTVMGAYEGKVEYNFRDAIRQAAERYSETELRAIFEHEIKELAQ